MDSLWKLKQDFFFSGYESAWLNGFSILLFIKREYLSSTLCNVKVQSVIPSERSVGTHQIDSVAPNPKGLHVCVLFVQRHPAASGNSQSPCAILWRQVLCDKFSQASFIKLCSASQWFVLHFFLFFVLLGGGGMYSWEDTETVKGREKDIWLVRRGEKEKVIESERKKSKTPKERKREWGRGPPAPLLFPGPLLTITFCSLISHHLFNLCWP